jgi:hypothetical protein
MSSMPEVTMTTGRCRRNAASATAASIAYLCPSKQARAVTAECYGDGMTAVPEWMRPPRLEGWYADDLDHLPEAPRHTELIDGALVFMMSPQRSWHARVVTALAVFLAEQAPGGIEVER